MSKTASVVRLANFSDFNDRTRLDKCCGTRIIGYRVKFKEHSGMIALKCELRQNRTVWSKTGRLARLTVSVGAHLVYAIVAQIPETN